MSDITWPIVEQMSPSLEQRPAIEARGRDVLVTAGAGAGKTRTLVARYLSLLAEGMPLRSVVAITFTKKAAREMRNRVRDEMRRYLERPDLDDLDRQAWQRLYSELDAARIDTIHGLCMEILRAHPAEAGIDPRCGVLDEGQIGILHNQAVAEALGRAADDEQAVRLFDLLGADELQATLLKLLAQRLDARSAFDRLPADVAAHWQNALRDWRAQRLDELLAHPEWRPAVAVLRDNAADAPDDRIEVQRQCAVAALDGAEGSPEERIASLSGLDSIALSGGSAKAWPGGKEQLQEVKEALRALRDLWRSQADGLTMKWTALDEALAGALPSLQSLFGFAAERYAALRRERNALDFDDLEGGALDLLARSAAARARWQREVGALLVDEFQDTNGRQRDLVKWLNGDGGRLFVVGDAKQSIYRFRGADVTVFRDERERIDRGGGTVFPLAKSYRAHRDLILGLNDLLRPLLGDAPDPARPWAEPFAPLTHDRANAGPGFVPPHIELHLAVGSKGGGALDRAARALAGRIAGMVESGAFHIVDHDRPRPLDYGDFAILCRASTSFAAYEDAMERQGVPFLTVAGRGFYGRPEIRDLLNALQALADPSDDLALAGLLRSPAFALSDAALYHLCAGHQAGQAAVSLWDRLQAEGGDLPGEDDPRRAARAAAVIAQLHERVGHTSVADVLKAFLDATDYRAALIQAGHKRGARNVAKLLADAHASQIVSIGEFLEYIGNLRDSGGREGEARATVEGAVQIMSVHAAKGLEFPVVVIGDITHSQHTSAGLLIDPELGVLLPQKGETDVPASIYRLGKTRADDQEDAESDRLFYVAATRAREKLILSGCIGLKQDGTLSKLPGWLGRIVGPQGLDVGTAPIGYDEDSVDVLCLDWHIGQTPVACAIYPAQKDGVGDGPAVGHDAPAAPFAADASISLPPPLLEPVAARPEPVDRRTADDDRSTQQGQRVWQVVPAAERPRAPRWVVGSLVHEALAAWRFPDGNFDRWAAARARSYGLTDPRQLVDATRVSRQLLLRFQGHPLCQAMAGAERRLHEIPYSLLVDGHVESGIIDAMYLHNGSWTIVEFKTDKVKDQAAIGQLLAEEDYLTQAGRYLAAVERLLGQRPRLILCLLDCGGAVYVESDL